VQKLVARLVLWLLTREGTDLVDPAYGSQLLSQLRGNNVLQMRANIANILGSAVLQWRQTDDDGLPPDEKLESIELLSFSSVAGAMALRIKIVTASGDAVQAVLPLVEPEVTHGH
jgi:hypothetical protein